MLLERGAYDRAAPSLRGPSGRFPSDSAHEGVPRGRGEEERSAGGVLAVADGDEGGEVGGDLGLDSATASGLLTVLCVATLLATITFAV
ncbi:hypothetical protein GCM10023323_60350 [Streptomyces thinghirensis]|uniref:Uncharacterized protein n=1 Tax=Streptomyces thinghirensis TaxID=551547 RepID=A0ABP9TAF4_9ACTN